MYKIWNETTIPVSKDGTMLVCSTAISKQHPDLESAIKKLTELADSTFGYSKYRKKKVKSIEKISDREYVVTLQFRHKIKERYYIH